jgi:hypothetical protein
VRLGVGEELESREIGIEIYSVLFPWLMKFASPLQSSDLEWR